MSANAATCARQQYIDSAKPCSSSTSGALASPATRASKVRRGEMEICSMRGIAENLDARECAVHHGVTIPSHILLWRTRLGVASRREWDVAETPFERFSVHVKAGMP